MWQPQHKGYRAKGRIVDGQKDQGGETETPKTKAVPAAGLENRAGTRKGGRANMLQGEMRTDHICMADRRSGGRIEWRLQAGPLALGSARVHHR